MLLCPRLNRGGHDEPTVTALDSLGDGEVPSASSVIELVEEDWEEGNIDNICTCANTQKHTHTE